MILDRLADIIELILLLARPHIITLVVQPGAHSIATAKHIRVTLAIDGTTATAHGKTHHRTVPLVAHSVVFLFDDRNKLLKEEVLIVPAWHVKIAVPSVMCIWSASIGHNDNHLAGFTRLNQLISDLLHMALVAPCAIIIAQAVQQIDYWICLAVGKAIGEIDIILDSGTEHLALDAICHDSACIGGKAGRKGCQNEDEMSCVHVSIIFFFTLSVLYELETVLKDTLFMTQGLLPDGMGRHVIEAPGGSRVIDEGLAGDVGRLDESVTDAA